MRPHLRIINRRPVDIYWARRKLRAKEHVNAGQHLFWRNGIDIPKRTQEPRSLILGGLKVASGYRQKSLIALARNANRDRISWYLNHCHFMGKFYPVKEG